MDELNMYDIKSICDEIIQCHKIKDKQKILKREIKNTKWMDYIFYIKSLTTKGIGKYKLTTWTEYDPEDALPFCTGNGNDLIEYLTYVNRGNKKDMSVIHASIRQYPEDLWEFLYKSVMKDLRMFLSPMAINEVYGKDFIPLIEYMQPADYFANDNNVYIRNKKYVITPILAGVKCVAIKTNGSVQLYGPNGVVFTNLQCIEDELRNSLAEDMVFDGCVCYAGPEELTYEERCKKSSSGLKKKENITTHIFYVYDCLTVKEYNNRKGEITYKDRRAYLSDLLANGKYVKSVPRLYDGLNRLPIKQWWDKAKADNDGGIYINLNSAPYQFRKSAGYTVLRSLYEIEAVIVDYILDENNSFKYFIVEYNGKRINIPLGYTNEQKEKFNEDTYLFIGQKCLIQHSGEKKRQDGEPYLACPTFVDIITTK